MIYRTDLGALYHSDCLEIFPTLGGGSCDLVFADPPFNLGKQYEGTDDDLRDDAYMGWCCQWLDECVRVLSPGGSLFLYNLPKWNVLLGSYLVMQGMILNNWVAVSQASSLPIKGRLYPAHYGLLYMTKGPAKTFHRIRTPLKRCKVCHTTVKDYGGHVDAMHPNGVTLSDFWDDIPVCRHTKYKPQARGQLNVLSTKLIERCLRMSTDAGDLVIDPFAGSGTTLAVCEKLSLRWIGIEKGPVDAILERLRGDVENHPFTDVVD